MVAEKSLKNLEERLQKTSEELNLLKNMLASLPMIFYLIDPQTTEILYTNERRDDSVQIDCLQRFGDTVYECIIRDSSRNEFPFSVEHIDDINSKQPKVQEVTGTPLRGKNDKLVGILLVVNDVSKYKTLYDSLTGLYSMDYINEQLMHLENQRNDTFGIIYGDIDYLKLANDVFGHSFGDSIIKRVANIMQHSFRKSDYVGRRGNKADEFIVLVRNPTKENLDERCRQLQEFINDVSRQVDYPLSVSIGYSMQNVPMESSTEVIRRAEVELYKYKNANHHQAARRLLEYYEDKINKKMPELQKHNMRIRELLLDYAEKRRMSQDDQDLLNRSIWYKDIGYVNSMMTPEMLNKRNITRRDFRKIKEHPEIGSEILSRIPWLVDCSNIVLHHHCNWNGTGYPDVGYEDIPKLSRLIRIGESLEHMIYGNIYSPEKYSVKEALDFLHNQSGALYDPDLVRDFRDYVFSLISFDKDMGAYTFKLPSGPGYINFDKELEN